MASNRARQNLPDRITGHTDETHYPGDGLARFRAQHALAVIVHVQPQLATAGAGGWPIAARFTDAPLVGGVVNDLFGDEGTAFLSGRTQPKKASFRLGRRKSILTHETRSSVLVEPVKCLTSSYDFVSTLLRPFTLKTPPSHCPVPR